MSSLQSQKRRIKSVDNTLSIANAMELVSSVKLKKLKNYYLECKEYFVEKSNAIREALSGLKEDIKLGEEEWMIVITSSLGLCGNYNDEIIKLLDKLDLKDKKIVVLGDKGISYFNEKMISIERKYNEYNESTSNELFTFIFDRFNQGLVRKIEIIYTNYKNNFIHHPVNEIIYPYSIDKTNKEQYLIETNVKELISTYIKDYLQRAFLESILSENASRNIAMHQSCENAGELKEELILTYNKTRQQQITNEIRDIVSGGE